MISTLSLILLILCICDASTVKIPLRKFDHTNQRYSSINKINSYVSRNADKIKALSASNPLNSGYLSDIQIGTPPQKFELLLETLSETFYVPSVALEGFEKLNKYDSSKSSSYVADGEIYNTTDDYCTFEGIYSTDTVTLFGETIKSVRFAEIRLNKEVYEYQTYDGSLGLAPLSPVLDSIWSSGSVPKKILSVYISGGPFEMKDGEIMLGDIDASRYEGSITYAKMTEQTQWKFKMDGFTLGKVDGCTSGCFGSFDLSTTTLTAPSDIVNKINEELKCTVHPNTMCFMKCDQVSNQPTLRFTIAGTVMELTPEEYIAPLGDECVNTIRDYDSGIDSTYLIGAAVVRKYYTILDAGEGRIGFAKAKSSQ